MKINELRVGNWYHSVKFNTPVKCELSDLYELCVKSDGAYNDPPIDEMFKPIPLTEEWLMVFGFEKMQCITFDRQTEWIIEYKSMGLFLGVLLDDYPETNPNCGCVSILLPKNIRIPAIPKDLYNKEKWTDEDKVRAANYTILNKKWRQPIVYYIKYVHQLQNLYFALTGKDLSVK